jgi:hypothetical protein
LSDFIGFVAGGAVIPSLYARLQRGAARQHQTEKHHQMEGLLMEFHGTLDSMIRD